MRIQTFHIRVQFITPDFFKNSRTGQNIIQIDKQHFKQIKLFFAQMHLPAPAIYRVQVPVDFDSAPGIHPVDKRFALAAVNSVYPGNQLFYLKRLNHKIVCARIQSAHTVFYLAFCRHKNNAALKIIFISQQAADFYPADFRQHPVQQHNIIACGQAFLYHSCSFCPILRPVHGAPFICQQFARCFAQFYVILHKQDFHDNPLSL